MSKPLFKLTRKLILSAVAVMVMSSCSSQKSRLTYFRDITDYTQEVPLPARQELKIAPDDELYITVTSEEPEATMQFNLPAANPATSKNLGIYSSPQQMTYLVDAKGDIDFPTLGEIHVAGMTTVELRQELVRRISKWVDNPQVNVRCMNYRVNVLGEVMRPGAKEISKERYSILDALADAGDMTPYGERNEVLLIREEDGKQKRVLLDLTSSEVLQSEYYYLQPNDYIYVRPNNVREGNAKYDSNKSYKLSMVSTVVSACSVVASLIIALAIK